MNNKHIKILVLVVALLALGGSIFVATSSNEVTPESLEPEVNTTELFNNGDYEEVQEITNNILESSETSDEEKAAAIYDGLNARIAFDNREFAYNYVIENLNLVESIELPFDFYVVTAGLAEEFKDSELAGKMYDKILSFEFEEGQVEEIYIQKEIREKVESE